MIVPEHPFIGRAKANPDHCPICGAVVDGVSDHAAENKGVVANFCSKYCHDKAAHIEQEYEDFCEDAYWDRKYEERRDNDD